MCANPARHRAQRNDESPAGAGFWEARDLLGSPGPGRSGKHARRAPSRYSLHIGRVGALAISLGVGLAVANGGVAYADSESDTSVAGPKSDESSPQAPSPQHDADETSTDSGDSDTDEDMPAEDEDDVDPDEDEQPSDGTDADPDGETPPVAEETDEESPEDVDVDDMPAEQPSTGDGVPAREVEEAIAPDDESLIVDDEVIEAPASSGDTAVVDVVAPAEEPAEQVSAPVEQRGEAVGVVTALVSTVVSPFVNPNAPAQAPWFDALLAWVRRQITHTFSNKTPIYGPITVEELLPGQLFIDLNATDPNGDPLTYEIIQPRYGLVVRDLITGKFIYTSTSLVTGAPRQDSFQVVIRDDSEHLSGALGSIQKFLHGVARLFGLAQKDNVTVTIPVTINPIVQLPPTVVTGGVPVFKLGDAPVKLLSSAIIADADSDRISKATIKIATSGQVGDLLNYVAPDGSPISATWDAATRTLTLEGLATAQQYEQALLSVTFSATKGGLPRGVAISVTDDSGVQSLVPGAALVTVVGLPPLVVVAGLPVFRLGGSPVKVASSVTITDGDSENLSGASVVIATGYKAGDVLAYNAVEGSPITASWDAASRTLTLSGVASIAEYEAAIKAVTFSTTDGGGLPRGISVSVVDDTDTASLVPGAAVVTVVGLPPVVLVGGLPVFRLGGAPVKVVSSVSITDGDSDQLSKATLTIGSLGYKSGDVLNYVASSDSAITASWDAATGTLTLSGVASIAEYEAAIKAVTFSATEGGVSRSISVSVVDDTDKESLVPGAAVVTVIGLPPIVTVGGLPIFRLGGAPVKVVSSVSITDGDSDQLSRATLTIGSLSYKSGDVLAYSAVDGSAITASWDAASGTLTLSGVASIAEYEAAIKAVTFSATEGGLSRTISVSVVDDTDKESLVPGAAVVTVIGLPPALAVLGAPIFRLGGTPVKVVSTVSITDGDSQNLSKATLTIGSLSFKAGDVLAYSAVDGSPITASWDAATRTLTLSGVASIAEYEAAIKAVTFSATEGGLSRTISVSVVDDTDKEALVPGAAVVTVVGLPPVVLVGGLPVFRLGGGPVKVVSSVSITDGDSDQLSKATLTIGSLSYKSGDVLSYVAAEGSPITASWDAATRTLTLSGVASIAEYEAAIKAVTFSTTEGGVSRSISVSVVDDTDKESLVPGAAVVTVVGLPPIVTVGGLPVFRLGGSPVKVVSSVTITDGDSENLSSASVVIATGYKAGDVLAYNAVEGSPITASWDAATGTLTLSGVASIAEYEAAIKAVTFSATEGGLSRTISVSVVDDTDKESLVRGAAVVTVVGLPPVVLVGGLPVFRLGGGPVKVVSSVSITDGDSDQLSRATLTIGSLSYKSGDVLSYVAAEGGPITASWDAATRTLTLSGVASIAEYETAIKAVTFSATEGGVSRSISVSVVDDTDKEALVPGAAVVTVVGLPPLLTVLGAPIFRLGGAPVKVVSSVSITDGDSDQLSKATLTIGSAGYKSGDMLSYNTIEGSAITASWDAATRTLTLSGVASIAEYEAAIKAVTFTATEGGLSRAISVSVIDDTEKESLVPGAAVVTVIGLPPVVTVGGLPFFRLGGAPVKVVSSVTITDGDSDQLSKATLTIGSAGYKSGDVLSYNAVEGSSITASWDAATRTLTLSGVASIAEYEAAIKAVTFSASEGGLSRAISVSVVDDTDKESLVPGAAVVTVIGLPPVVTVGGLPIFRLGGAPVKVVSSVTITDGDSDQLSKATLTIGSAGYKSGDVLSYSAVDGSSITASWDAATRTLTLSGVASIAEYEAAIKAVTFSATEGGLSRAISVSVVDDTDKQSLVPGAAVVTVIGLPPVVTVGGLSIFRLGGSPVKVVSSVDITDADSDNLSKATLTIGSVGYKSGDVLSYNAVEGSSITASWDAATRTLTLSGVASIAEYDAAIKAVTFSATEGGLSRAISVSVTDDTDKESLVPGAAVVTVIGLPPIVTVGGLPIFRLGGSPVKVVSSVDITDADSDNLSKATLTIGSLGYKSGDVLSYVAAEGGPITASWDAATRTLTLSGVASIAEYEAAIKAVTFSASEGGVSRSISVSVVDDTDKESLVPGAAVVTVVGLPPVVLVGGLPVFRLGGSPVKVVSSVTITDGDSENLSSASVVIATGYKAGDVLSYNAVEGSPITASWDAATGTLTLSGVASIAEYEAAIKAVTFTATEGGVARSISVSVTDDTDKESLVPGAAVVTVIGLPPALAVLGAPVFRLGGSPVKVVSTASITDGDSQNLSKATLTIGSLSFKAGDVLAYNAVEGSPIAASWDAATRTLTLSGVASIAEYEAAIKAVTFTATEGGVSRSISVSVTDDTDKESLVPGAAVVTVIGLPPVVTVGGLPIFRLGGSPVKVVSSVTITDGDSDQLSKATLTIGSLSYKSGDVLNYVVPADSAITASWDAATRTLTLSGVASIAEYEAAIKAVTFSASEGGLSRSISVSVVDDTDKESLVPGAAVVTVVGLPPVVAVGGLPIFRLGGAPVKVVSSVSITDGDSENLSKATLTIGSVGYKSGDALAYSTVDGSAITASWDAATRTLTLSGVASIAEYEAAIKAVTFSASEGGVSRSISVSVTDDTEKESLVPGAAVVTVVGLPPIVTVGGLPVFRLGGAPVKVVSSVNISDGDSDQLSRATLTIGSLSYRSSDVLSYNAVAGSPITGSWDAATQTLTLSGVASIAEYEAAIKAVTFSTTEGGVSRSISVSVVDDTDKESLVPGAAVVTVVGLPPIVTVGGLPIFRLGGSPVKVVSSVTITDGDSDQLSKATLTVGSLSYKSGDVLAYSGVDGSPITASWDAATGTLTLSGVASIAEYEAAIKAVTFTASEGGVSRSISVSVVDDTDKESLVPGAAVVTVVGLPPVVTVGGLPIFRLGGAPVKVVSSVTITDADSENLSKATLTIGSLSFKAGDVLAYTAVDGSAITASWDAATGTLTLSGVASIAEYEAAIKAVTFTATEGGVSRSISVSVTDDTDKESLVPGAAVVTVIGLPPALAVLGAPIFRLGGSPVKVVSSVTITDGDSESLSKATLTIGSVGYKSGDVLAYSTVDGSPITASWDAATRTLTLSGVASIAEYEAAIKAVTFATTEGGVARSISVSVIDDTDKESVTTGVAMVSVVGLPPSVAVLGAPIFRLGGSPVKVVSSATISDLDSDNLSGATIAIATAYKSGDVLAYNAVAGSPITGSWDAATRTLTLSGVASIAEYEAAIKAVTFSTTDGGVARGLAVHVTDDVLVRSVVAGMATVSVVGLPPSVTVLGAPIFRLGGSPVKVVSSATISDLDSDNLAGATITIGAAYQNGDVLNYVAANGVPITGAWDAAARTLTLTGVATKAQYEEAIKAVTFTTDQGGVTRGIQIHVIDETAVRSILPASAAVTVVGLPPSVTTIGAPTFTIGGAPVKLLSSVSVADADSDRMSRATVRIATLAQSGDVLGYVAPSGNPITATWDATTRTLTLSGVATKAQYEQALEAVTFSATGGAGIVRGISVTVTDDTDVDSALPGVATANVRYSLPPSVVTAGSPTHTIGGAPTQLLASASISDVDSDRLSSARVTIETLGQSGDTLGYIQPSGSPITATWDAGSRTLTLSGVGTKAQYEEALKAVTFSAGQGAGLVRGFSISVSDETGVSSSGLLNGVATAGVRNPLPPSLTTTGWPSHTRNGSATTALVSASILDADSDYMTRATVRITNASSNDKLMFTPISGNPITAVFDASTHTLTLTGVATKNQYEAALEAVKFTATQNGLGAVRNLTWVVTDETGQTGSGTSLLSVLW